MLNDNVPLSRFSDSSDELERSRSIKQPRNSFDEEEWFPARVQQVLCIDSMPVIKYDVERIFDLAEDLVHDQYCGLTIIRDSQQIGSFVCLTTSQSIVVMKLADRYHVKHLKALLKKKEFTFFVMHGAMVADTLDNYGIRVRNFIDLTTFDIHIKLRTHFTERVPLRGKYYFSHVRESVRITPLNYRKLADKWLDVKIDICSADDYKSLESEDLDVRACNVIRKAAALTRAIGLRMWEHFDKLHQSRRDQIFAFGVRAPDDIIEAYRRGGEETWDHLAVRLNQCPSSSYFD